MRALKKIRESVDERYEKVSKLSVTEIICRPVENRIRDIAVSIATVHGLDD
jgi:hypothetical protein